MRPASDCVNVSEHLLRCASNDLSEPALVDNSDRGVLERQFVQIETLQTLNSLNILDCHLCVLPSNGVLTASPSYTCDA